MIPLLAASLLLRVQGEAATLPRANAPSLPAEVLDWPGLKYLPAGPRVATSSIPVSADWSGVKGVVAPNATPWRVKVFLLERIDRAHDRGREILWPGHYGMIPSTIERVKRALPQWRALVGEATGGAVDLRFDVEEATEVLSLDGGDLPALVREFLAPRFNGGRYDAEDGLYRGPYASVVVVHPVGGESPTPLRIHVTPVALVGLPDILGVDADGVLAAAFFERWQEAASQRASDAGLPFPLAEAASTVSWPAVAPGADNTTADRLHLLATKRDSGGWSTPVRPHALGPVGVETVARIAKDPLRDGVLVVEERGALRGGGVSLPTAKGFNIDTKASPTLVFWAKSDAKDPVVVQAFGDAGKPLAVQLGRDVPFRYDDTWQRVKVDLRPAGLRVERIAIAPDQAVRREVRRTIGPIVASFSDFETTSEAPDAPPAPESPSPTSLDPEVRARWAATAGPGEERRALLKDPIENVRANAAFAALAKPDPADEVALAEDAINTFESSLFTPAIRALGKLGTPTARTALLRTIRIAASDRARGLAAEVLAESGDPKLVPQFVGLNQARHSAARRAAVRALARIKGEEAALMRMAYLPQTEPEVKLEVTRSADANDDYQGRKLLWSAVNEPSDAVRLESLRRLSYSTVPQFRSEGLKGVHDDSVGVRVGLLRAWTTRPNPNALPAIREALTDRAPRVRATALDALAASVSALGPQDLPFDDEDPRVQRALLRLCTAKSIPISDAVRQRLKSSPDPEVRRLAQS